MANKKSARLLWFSFSAACRKGLSAAFAYQTCIVCGVRVYGSPVCADCRKNFLLFSSPMDKRCPYCGRVLVSEKDSCMECRSQRVILSADSVFALHPYRLWNKNLLFQWKMHGERSLVFIFAEAVYAYLHSINCMTVVPVPPRPGKIRAKGWDQIDDLAMVLKAKYGVAVFPMLKRLSTEQQKKKNRVLRLSKVSSYALSCCKNVPDEAVLLDDVITTGATAQECSSLLKKAGVAKVNVLSLFIVD